MSNSFECLDYSQYGECMLYTNKVIDEPIQMIKIFLNIIQIFVITSVTSFTLSGVMMLYCIMISKCLSGIYLLFNHIKLYSYSIKDKITKFKNVYEIYNGISLDENDENKESVLTIIRGVPGSGKKHLAYHLENDRVNNNEIEEDSLLNITILSNNDYFIKDGKYEFNGKNLGEAIHLCKKSFLEAIHNNKKKLYVIGCFNKKWLYEEYIMIAELCGYNIKIIDIQCDTKDELRYFNNRSTHDVPIKKSLQLYNDWELDERSEYFKAYFNYLSTEDDT